MKASRVRAAMERMLTMVDGGCAVVWDENGFLNEYQCCVGKCWLAGQELAGMHSLCAVEERVITKSI